MKRLFIFIALISIIIIPSVAQKTPRTEVYKTKDGKAITFHLYGHASLAIEAAGSMIYIDPVEGMADFSKQKKADAIFITHSHGDHFDQGTIKKISKATTIIYCDKTSAKDISEKKVITMEPGDMINMKKEIKVNAIAAYNFTKGHIQFHPKERKDCGYLFTIGKARIYVAGDSENTTEMKALKKIDVAFLPVNQPYTMTAAQAVDVIRTIRPKLFIPYHYGNVKEKTDIEKLVKETEKYTTIRIKDME